MEQRPLRACFDAGGAGAQNPRVGPVMEVPMRGGRLQSWRGQPERWSSLQLESLAHTVGLGCGACFHATAATWLHQLGSSPPCVGRMHAGAACKRSNGLWAQHLEKCWGKTQVGLTWDSRHEGLGGEMEMCKQQGKQVRRGEGKQAVDSLDSLGKTLEGHSGRVTRVLWMECLLGEKCLFL